tara:strand:+ start:354 stop:785 length:432 start_codon:yes stop_codon:yes gene_type:complete
MAVSAVVAAVGTAGVIVAKNAADEQKRAQDRALAEQRKANEQARQTAEAEAQRAEIAYNQANQQKPEVQAIISRSQEAAQQGPASTVLTGGSSTVNPVAQAVAKGKTKKSTGRGDASGGSLLTGQVGVDPSALNLGGNSLLGN